MIFPKLTIKARKKSLITQVIISFRGELSGIIVKILVLIVS